MRLSKFRGYDKIADTWVVGFGVVPDSVVSGRKWIMFNDSEGVIIDDPDTIGEWTRLYDKNGEHIFEGDIIKRIDTGGTQVCVWKNDRWLFRAVYDSWLKQNILNRKSDVGAYIMTTFKIEVIGNIHENPNLLKP